MFLFIVFAFASPTQVQAGGGVEHVLAVFGHEDVYQAASIPIYSPVSINWTSFTQVLELTRLILKVEGVVNIKK